MSLSLGSKPAASAGAAPLHAAAALDIAGRVKRRELSATEVVKAALARVERRNPELNAFSTVTSERALARAAEIDAAVARGEDPGALAGVPFAAKNLFDVAGVTTLSGSIIERRRAPAERDATAVARLETAGAICVGCLTMDEYAYGFTTENSHYGPTHNPHDLARTAGGSSGGSGAAVAGGLATLSMAASPAPARRCSCPASTMSAPSPAAPRIWPPPTTRCRDRTQPTRPRRRVLSNWCRESLARASEASALHG
jgi:hypothetical protein